MIERKDTPAPFMKRQHQPPPLEIRTNVKRASQSDSPPHTPPPNRIRTRGKRASSKTHATPRETYLNGLTDGDNARGGDEPMQNERVSHDLSLTDNTRSSVVDNMLLSLNPDQSTPFSTPPSSQPFLGTSRFTPPRSSHRRGHTQSSSLSTDYTFPSNDSPLRSPGQLSRSHRSNNSSIYQSALGRIDSLHGEEDQQDLTKAKIQAIRGTLGEKASDVRTLRKSRKSSKSSGASSVDFGHIMGQPRWQSNMDRRSSSSEHNHNRGIHSSSSIPVMNSPIVHSVSQPLHSDVSDAAPTPTIPVGPRIRDSAVFPPQPAHAPPQTPTYHAKSGNKSSKYHNSRKKKGEKLSWDGAIMPGVDILDNRHESQDMPSVPAFIISRNPSPTRRPQENPVSYRHASVPQVNIPKERPGFFRRVFGSSKNILYSTPDVRHPQPQSSRDSIRADTHGGLAFPHKLTKSPPAEENIHPPKENIPPALAKKSSSFFRRRKKSISEHNPTPTLPVRLQPRPRPDPIVTPTDKEIESSPVSSLREVMNEYLGSSVTSQPRRDEVDGQATPNHQNIISVSTLGRNETGARPTSGSIEYRSNDRSGLSRHNHQKEASSIVGISSGNGAKLKANDILVQSQHSFLHDSSSTETRTARSTENGETSLPSTALSDQAPTSHPKDMAPSEGKLKINTTSVDLVDDPLQQIIERPAKSRTLSSRSGNVPASPRDGLKGAKNKSSHTSPQATPTSKTSLPLSISSNVRAWLEPEDEPEDDLRKLERLQIPVDDTQLSPASIYLSAASTFPNPGIRELSGDENAAYATVPDITNVHADETEPIEDDRVLAKRIYEEDESLVPKAKAAAWLGEADPSRSRVRRAYMELFNWQNLNILAALRVFCGRLLLKGETQQVDRLLDAFSSRWCVCNPDHGFKATDVVHTICYSVLLLNTDLHMADIEQKMTRAQFIKNTLPTIRRVVIDAAPDSFDNARASILPAVSPWTKPTSENTQSPTFSADQLDGRRSFEGARPSYRLSSRPSDQSGYLSSQPSTPLDTETPSDDCGPLVKTQFRGKMSSWEAQVEIVLKDFFNSIRQQRLPLHGSDDNENMLAQPSQFNTLSAMTGNMLRRTPSMISKSGSENIVFRGRPLEHRLGTGRWTSKTRSRPRVYPSSAVGSSRTSFEDQSSTWSPAMSSTWSKYSLGKTQTSMSIDSFASSFPQGDYQQSIGFANALSQAIIREESGADTTEDSMRITPLLEDESLELAGAPWAKEGILKHKHHLESVDKKAKDRNWVESFAVIEKGWMRLFSFSMNAKSMRQKAKNQKAPGGVVGGGNWADSAESLGEFLLRQTIASALPPPGYSKTRQHVWALSLPTGAVHLFQVGTPEIVKEFVSTANYWSARLSKEPLVGGVSNIEYGWSNSVVNAALLYTESMPILNPGTGPRPSLQSSIRSSVDQGSCRPKLPGDKITISDWSFPQQSMLASVLLEIDQLKALSTYVKNIEEDLQKHNELRSVMLLAFSPRHPNSARAMANWERKSSYLLREIVKFRTYIDSLQAAKIQKEKIYASRAPPAAAEDKQEKENEPVESMCTITNGDLTN